MRGALAAAVALLVLSCAPAPARVEPPARVESPTAIAPPAPVAPPAAVAPPARTESIAGGEVATAASQPGTASVVRVLLTARARREVTLAALDGDWRLYEEGGRALVARGIPGRTWRVERAGGGRLRAVREDGVVTAARPGPFLARVSDDEALLTLDGKRWRGDLLVVATDTGLLVVNQLGVEDYLRGVVPLEIGNRPASERAAAEAQAVAARSYVYVRADGDPRRRWDLVAGVADQVYGGVEAEREVSDAAVRTTAGEVLWFGGRAVSAPYSAVCGGTTAEPPEVWRSGSEPYLRRVSDVDPATGRAWCSPSPRFRWTRTFTGAQLDGVVARYLRGRGERAVASGRVRSVRIARTTPSGRVGTLAVDADGGTRELRGNDIRYALRAASGEILPSTYFSVESAVVGRDGRLSSLTLRGTGNGHGVGMCQWGAIGRARAGHDYRRILQAYFPGTTLRRVE